MRIGLLIYGTLDTLSGGYLYDRLCVDFLRRQGHTVEIISIPWRNYAAHLRDNWSQKLRQRLHRLQVDLLIQDELNHPSLAWLNPWLKERVNYPLVSIVHHLRISENHPAALMPLYRTVEKRFLGSLDGFVYNSKTTQEAVESLLVQSRPSIVVFPSASHIAAPESKQLESQMRQKQTQPLFKVLFVGNLIERKGLHTLLDGLTGIKTDDWHLDIAGNDEVDVNYTQRIQAQIARAGVRGRIVMHGKVSDERLRELYASAHVLAVPSYEGFGIVYLEAMAFGMPVIASTAGAAHEIVEQNINGFLVAPESAEEIGQLITALALDREHWLAMGMAARQRYDNHPSWETGFARLEGWLQNIQKTG